MSHALHRIQTQLHFAFSQTSNDNIEYAVLMQRAAMSISRSVNSGGIKLR